jgi:L-serine deaminase
MKHRFKSLAERTAVLSEEGIFLEEYMIRREVFIAGSGEDAVYAELDRRIAVTRRVLVKGLETPGVPGPALPGGLRKPSPPRSAAFPAAGSSGIVPGVIWVCRDVREEASRFSGNFSFFPCPYVRAAGTLIVRTAILAGAEGGCRAERGAAEAKAACAPGAVRKGAFW